MSNTLGYRSAGGPAGIIASAPRGGYQTLGNVGYSSSTTYKRDARGTWETGSSRYGTTTAAIGNAYSLGTATSPALTQGGVNVGTPRVSRSSSVGVSTRGYSRVAKTPQQQQTYGTNIYSTTPRSTTPSSRYRNTTNTYLTTTQSPIKQPSLRSGRVTLVLDLDETLVHSSFDPIPADLHIPLVMDGEHYVAYVNKRPHMEAFLAKCVELFDVIVWTASLSVYAEPLVNELCRMARCGNIRKMYREHCTEVAGGGYVKDLSSLGRSLNDVCILDNSPSVALFQPQNLIPIVSWYEDKSDTALLQLFPFLEKLAQSYSVQSTIAASLSNSSSSSWAA